MTGNGRIRNKSEKVAISGTMATSGHRPLSGHSGL